MRNLPLPLVGIGLHIWKISSDCGRPCGYIPVFRIWFPSQKLDLKKCHFISRHRRALNLTVIVQTIKAENNLRTCVLWYDSQYRKDSATEISTNISTNHKIAMKFQLVSYYVVAWNSFRRLKFNDRFHGWQMHCYNKGKESATKPILKTIYFSLTLAFW